MEVNEGKIIAKRVFELCAQNGISQSKMADDIGMSRSTIRGWTDSKKPRKPQAAIVKSIADYFGVSIDYLTGKEEEIYEARRPEETERLPSSSLSEDISIDRIPILEETEGNPVIQFDDTIPFMQLPDAPEPDFCVLVRDNSMELFGIHEGDAVFCETAKDVESGEIAAVILDQNTLLRRVYKSPIHPDTIILSAGTPEYPPLFIKNADPQKLRVIGKAVSIMSSVRLFK